MSHRVALYFVASPLQYLAARAIARTFEQGSRQVLVWYKPGVGPVVRPEDWHESRYMPWPRLEPLPGLRGRWRRQLANLEMVRRAVGLCDELVIHSAVFDTGAINYFLDALRVSSYASSVRARILPDGLISIRRYPLSPVKRLAQRLRMLRDRLLHPGLRYTPFSGDRIGSDAPFCDRIYVLPRLPNEYPPGKVVELPPLVDAAPAEMGSADDRSRRALVIGQPLVDTGLMTEAGCAATTAAIRQWLRGQGYDTVDYKGHPKDPARTLACDDYRDLALDEPLETFMGHHAYGAVVGVRSSALLFARQIYPVRTRVVAFGWNLVRFKSGAEHRDMQRAFEASGVELQPVDMGK